MAEIRQNEMNCADFEALLMEAVEGALAPAEAERCRLHVSACQLCGPLFAEGLAGYQALHGLAEAEPPAYLLHNILAATSEAESAARKQAAAAQPAWLHGLLRDLRQWMAPIMAGAMQPRIAGSFAMAFFSVTLLLNVAGFRFSDLRGVNLRPSAIRSTLSRQYYQATARVERYYDSVRIVYELESRVRELKNAALPPEQEKSRPEERKKPRQNKEKGNGDISNRPEEQNQNYVQQRGEMIEASLNLNLIERELAPPAWRSRVVREL
jgi:hypothetical protein